MLTKCRANPLTTQHDTRSAKTPLKLIPRPSMLQLRDLRDGIYLPGSMLCTHAYISKHQELVWTPHLYSLPTIVL